MLFLSAICRKTRRVLEQAEIIREKPKGFVSYAVGLLVRQRSSRLARILPAIRRIAFSTKIIYIEKGKVYDCVFEEKTNDKLFGKIRHTALETKL